jgi:hypothetical protein
MIEIASARSVLNYRDNPSAVYLFPSAITAIRPQQTADLFDNIVGAGQQPAQALAGTPIEVALLQDRSGGQNL